MEQEKERLRKEHRKSRNGCVACKKRHVRCDERKPSCKSCVVRGYACHYVVRNGGSTRERPLKALMPSSVEFDPFDCLPVKFSKRSLEIFHHFNNFRLLAQTKASSENVQGLLSTNAIYYHSELIISAMFYSWLHGSYKEVEETYIFHKLEIIRIVNETISESPPMAKPGIVEAINSLSMTEAGVGEITASEVHLEGLSKVYEQAAPGHMQIYQIYWHLSKHLMLIIGSFMAAARKAEGDAALSISFYSPFNEDNNEAIPEAGTTPSFNPSYSGHLTPTLLPNSSAAWATAAYLYLSIVCFGEWRPGGRGNPHLIRWLLDWVRAKLNYGYAENTGSSRSELWLWRVAVGAYVLTVAGSSSAVEKMGENDGNNDEGSREMAKLVEWYTTQLSKSRRATWVPGWETAEGVLGKIHWLQIPGSHGELVLEKTWQDSVGGSNRH